jgi:hypothetical protein
MNERLHVTAVIVTLLCSVVGGGCRERERREREERRKGIWRLRENRVTSRQRERERGERKEMPLKGPPSDDSVELIANRQK